VTGNDLLRWARGFGQFWYRFIVGDDWSAPAIVAAALVLTAVLVHASLPAWWLVPLATLVALTVGLRRTAGRR
jgi:hypothetical protein